MSPLQRIAMCPQLFAYKQSHIQPTEAWEDDDMYIFSSCSSCVLSKACRSQRKSSQRSWSVYGKAVTEDFSIPQSVNWILTLILQTLRESGWAFLSNPILDTFLVQYYVKILWTNVNHLRQLSPAFSPSLQCQFENKMTQCLLATVS